MKPAPVHRLSDQTHPWVCNAVINCIPVCLCFFLSFEAIQCSSKQRRKECYNSTEETVGLLQLLSALS